MTISNKIRNFFGLTPKYKVKDKKLTVEEIVRLYIEGGYDLSEIDIYLSEYNGVIIKKYIKLLIINRGKKQKGD